MKTTRAFFAATLLFALATVASAATFTVTTAADSGAGSLRQALTDAAALPGADTINFAPELNGQTITLASEIVLEMNHGGGRDRGRQQPVRRTHAQWWRHDPPPDGDREVQP